MVNVSIESSVRWWVRPGLRLCAALCYLGLSGFAKKLAFCLIESGVICRVGGVRK